MIFNIIIIILLKNLRFSLILILLKLIKKEVVVRFLYKVAPLIALIL
jgi:hypothetical protein